MEGFFKKKGEAGFFEVEIVKIHDTRWIYVNIYALDICIQKRKMRIYGTKCHDLRSGDPYEKASADLALKEIYRWIYPGKKYLAYVKDGDIQVFVDGDITLNQKLIEGGFTNILVKP